MRLRSHRSLTKGPAKRPTKKPSKLNFRTVQATTKVGRRPNRMTKIRYRTG